MTDGRLPDAVSNSEKPHPPSPPASTVGRGRAGTHRSDALGVAAVTILLLLAFVEVVFGGKTLSASASAAGVEGLAVAADVPADRVRVDKGASSWAFEPWAEINDRILDQGDLPLWNPYQGIGAPHAANMQSGVLDPLLLPANLSSRLWVRDLLTLATFLAGAIAMYGFVRILGLGAFESVVGAGAFSLTGWFFIYSNNTFAREYVFLPVLFLLVELMVRRFRPWHVLALGVATAASIAIGMPEATFVVLGASGVYGVVRSIQTRATNSWRVLARLTAGYGLGLALAAPLLTIFLEYLPQSFSVHESGSGVGEALDPTRLMLNLLAPFYAGDPLLPIGAWSGTRGWIGAGVVTLAIAGLSGRRLTRRFNALVFAGFALVVVLRVYDFGVLNWTGHLPIFERVNFPVFALPALPFFLAVTAAIGLAVIRARDIDIRRFGLLISIATLWGLTLGLDSTNRTFAELNSRSGLLRSLALPLLVASAVAIAVVLAKRWPVAVTIAGLLAVAELMVLVPRGIYPTREDPYPVTPSVEALRQFTASDPLGRIFAFDGELFPNTAGAYGLYDIRALDALYVDRYFRYVQEYIQPTAFDRFVGGPYASNEDVFSRYIGNPMFDMLGVRYLVTNEALPNSLLYELALTSPTDLQVLDIPGEPRTALYLHPPAKVELPNPPSGATTLAFAIGMDSAAFADERSDGALFSVRALDSFGDEVTLFSETYVPRVDPVSPQWRDRRISLVHDGFPVTSLSLTTEILGNPSTDWAGWADLVYLDDPQDLPPPGVTLAAVTDNSLIYANENALPRAWVATTVHAVDDMEGAVAFLNGLRDAGGVVVDFSPTEEVVVEGTASTAARCEEPSEVTVSAYDSDRVELTATTQCPGFLVLADAFYPGWHAEVNGVDEKIYPANVALRAVAVPAGTSTVTFSYNPASFRFGLWLAVIGLGAFAAWALSTRVIRLRSVKADTNGSDPSEEELPK